MKFFGPREGTMISLFLVVLISCLLVGVFVEDVVGFERRDGRGASSFQATQPQREYEALLEKGLTLRETK